MAKMIIREYSLIDEGFDNYVFDKLENEYEIDEFTAFVFDGCHKIYLVEDMEDVEDVKKKWGKDEKFYSIDELPMIWKETCPLRFISNWKLDKQYVRQCYDAEFEIID